jgi:DNA-binding XRE family transcriptional regulator
MCKHVAAVLYGVGARLDERPELLFLLRGVDQEELIVTKATATSLTGGGKRSRGAKHLAEGDLADLFGIDLLPDESSNSSLQISKQSPSADKSKQSQGGVAGLPSVGKNKQSKENVSSVNPGKAKPAKEKAPPLPATGKAVRELRHKFDITQSELGLLVGVSAASISKWENKSVLDLQPQTMSALATINQLTKTQLLRRLSKA